MPFLQSVLGWEKPAVLCVLSLILCMIVIIPAYGTETGKGEIMIDLDKTTYTWTDRVHINITAPARNLDSSRVDMIGGEDDPLRISTKKSTLLSYRLLETGPNTGVFAGAVTLTGFPHDADGYTYTGDSDGNDVGINTSTGGLGPINGNLSVYRTDMISVVYGQPGLETTAIAQIQWNIGEIEMLKVTSSILVRMIRVTDPDMNWNPDAADEFDVYLFSTTRGNSPASVTVTETGDTTGIFEKLAFFTSADTTGSALKISLTDKITARYNDHTLPEPHALNDSMRIYAFTTLINPTVIEKKDGIADATAQILIREKTVDSLVMAPRVLSGSVIGSSGSEADVNLMVYSPSGICVIGRGSECLVSESTRSPGEIYKIVEADGISLKVRYSGPDARPERFSILPESDEFLPDAVWRVDILGGSQGSEFSYKVTYKRSC